MLHKNNVSIFKIVDNKRSEVESGLYLIPTPSGSRYYSPIMKSFISACNIDEILYNLNIPGNLNPYAIGNPLYFPVYGYNIFTSMPLVPEISTCSGWNLPEWARITIGVIAIGGSILVGGIPALIGVGVGAVVGAGFEFGRQAFAGNGFDLGKIGMSALGGATAGGIAAIGGGYTAAFLLGGTGAAVGGTVTGSVNNFSSAVVHFGIGAALNVTGKFVGDKVSNGVNKLLQERGIQNLGGYLGQTMKLGDLIAYKAMDQTMKGLINYATNQIFYATSGFYNSILYLILNEAISSILTGWYD